MCTSLFHNLYRIQHAMQTSSDPATLSDLLAALPDTAGDEDTLRIHALLQGITAIASARQTDIVAEALVRAMQRVLQATLVCLWRWSALENDLSLWMQVSNEEVALPLPGLRNLAAHALEQSRPVQGPDGHRPHPLMQWPIWRQEQPWGVLQTLSDRPLQHADLAAGELLVQQAILAFDRLEDQRHLRRRAAMLEQLQQITMQLTASLDLNEVLSQILQSVDVLLQGNLESAHIFLYDGETLRFEAARFRGRKQHAPVTRPRPDGLTREVIRQGRAVVILNAALDPRFAHVPGVGSVAGLPLKIGDRIVGVMNVLHRHRQAFDMETLQILHLLADQAAIAIENARLHRMVTGQALTDQLTSLPNRRALDVRLSEEINRAERYGGQFCLMMLDLNGFKRINDRFGHPVGDRVLRQIAARLRQALRESDFLARYGGDEFAVILPQTDLQAARKVARKMSDLLSGTPVDLPDESPTLITLGIGVAAFPQHGRTAEDLLRAADSALYVAKDHPQQNIQTFDAAA